MQKYEHAHDRLGKTGFTMVELLIIIGLISLLIAILLPALNKAREAANQVKCMSNLRQLAMAFVMYANNNRQHLPASGFDLGPPDGVGSLPDDWIYVPPLRDVNQSAIQPYLGSKGAELEAVLRCPSDDPDAHPVNASMPLGYPYSYLMNYLLDGHCQYNPHSSTYSTPYNRVRHPAEKILLAESDERGMIFGGSWWPGYRSGHWMIAYDQVMLSIRHDRPASLADPIATGWISPEQLPNPGRRGNVAFCDAHVEFVSRLFAQSQAHADPQY